MWLLSHLKNVSFQLFLLDLGHTMVQPPGGACGYLSLNNTFLPKYWTGHLDFVQILALKELEPMPVKKTHFLLSLEPFKP